MFKKALVDCFTCKDNVTFDVGRVLWAIATLCYTGIVTMQSIRNCNIDPITLASGFTIILGGGATSLRIKSDTEPTKGIDDVKTP